MPSERKPSVEKILVGDSAPKHGGSSFKYFLIIPIVFVFFMGVEIIRYTVYEWTQFYIKSYYFPNESFHKNTSVCEDGSESVTDDYKKVQQQTSYWLLYFKIAEYVPTMLAAFILPTYSDALGRRKLLLLSGLGSFTKTAAVALTIYFNLPLFWILIGYLIEGISGGAKGYMCLCFSYVADKTDKNTHRVFAITAIETTVLLTSTIGGFVTGFMVESNDLGYKYTAIICLSLIAFSLIFTLLFLAESLPNDKRTAIKPLLVTIKRTFDFCFNNEFKGRRKFYILLLLSFAFTELSESNRSGLETLYFLGKPFCWDPVEIGYYSMARHASKGIMGIALLPIMQFCLSNEAIAVLSTLSNLSSYIIEAFAKSTLVVYMATISGVLTFLVVPMIRGMMSTMTSQDKQGSLFASITVVETGSSIISSLTQNSVYSATVSAMNGFVFLVMAGFCLIDCFLLILFWRMKPKLEVLYERINDPS